MTETIICHTEDRVCQGDIFRDIEYFDSFSIDAGIVEIARISFPHIVVLTQDCDLAQDLTFRHGDSRNQDKVLLSILVAPIYNLEFFLNGEHLSELDLSMRDFRHGSKTAINDIKNNSNPRYHFFDFGRESQLPPSIVDFKHYFAVNIKYLEDQRRNNRLFRIKELYREDISQRFSSFLSRIGLPDE